MTDRVDEKIIVLIKPELPSEFLAKFHHVGENYVHNGPCNICRGDTSLPLEVPNNALFLIKFQIYFKIFSPKCLTSLKKKETLHSKIHQQSRKSLAQCSVVCTSKIVFCDLLNCLESFSTKLTI